MPTEATFRIAPSNLHAFEKKMASLTRKAAKLACGVVGYRKGAAGVQFSCGCGRKSDTLPTCEFSGTSGHEPHTRAAEYVEVTVFGESPKFDGWTFAATLEPLADGVNLVRSISGTDLPEEYRTAKPRCEHCKLARHRKDTFVLVHEDGRTIQVGRQCVRDFLGRASPEKIAEAAMFVAELLRGGGDEDGFGFGGGGENVHGLVAVLAYAVREVGENGYVPKSSGKPPFTADTVQRMVCGPYDRLFPMPSQATPEEIAKATQIAEHFAAIVPASDFEHNVCAIARAGFVGPRHYGYAVSLVNAYERAMGRDAVRRKAAGSAANDHFGTVGKREVFVLTLMKVLDFDGEYGTLHLHLFEDAGGNAAKWGTTSARLDVGKRYSVKATVKKHEEYKGRKQTVLSRCAAEVVVEDTDSKAIGEYVGAS